MTDLTPPSRSFVLGLADRDGHLDGAALYELGAAIGFTDTTIRLAVRRLVEAGLVTSDGRGRGSSIELTGAGLADRAPDLGWTAFAYRLDADPDAWDGRWHLVSFEIPESARAGRDALRGLLVDFLGAPLGGGLYVSPHEWEPWADAMAALHDIGDHVSTFTTTDLRVGRDHDPRAIAARLWPLDRLDDRAGAFVARWQGLANEAPADLADAARASFTASAEFEALIRQDPLLPTELEPPGWHGAAMRDVYRRLVRSLSDRHPTIERANVFAAFLDAVDETAAMSEPAFATWLWQATRPR